jgi:hypothetical protein
VEHEGTADRARTTPSPPDLLVLHAVRLRGFASTAEVAARYHLDPRGAGERLLDHEAHGRVLRADVAGGSGWTLTDAGRVHDDRLLAAEVAATPGAADALRAAYAELLPLDARLRTACTDWDLRPTPGDPFAPNDHADTTWDATLLAELASIRRSLRPLAAWLTATLPRFDGYADRYAAALDRALGGDPAWVTGGGVDSCLAVWTELHEDLVATLGGTG